MGIRDLFDAPDSDINKALKSLNELLGASLTLQIPWQDVVRDLKKHFADDMELLTQCVAEAITMFLSRLEQRLDNDEHFQDTFLEKFRSIVQQIFVAVSKLMLTIFSHYRNLPSSRCGAKGSSAPPHNTSFRNRCADEVLVSKYVQAYANWRSSDLFRFQRFLLAVVKKRAKTLYQKI